MFITDLHQFLRELVRDKFYGVVEIRFESGHVAIIRKSESIKLLGDEPIRFRHNQPSELSEARLSAANLHKNEVGNE